MLPFRYGYGFTQAPAAPDGSGYVPSAYVAPSFARSPDSPILCAVYIPPKHAREPDKIYLSACAFGQNSDPSTVVTLHVSVGPVTLPPTYAARGALYLPGVKTSVFGAGTTPNEVLVDPSPLERQGQTLVSVHSYPLYPEAGNNNMREPHVIDLNGHPGDPQEDGLLVVAHAPSGMLLQLSLTPMPHSRQRMQQACGQPMTRDDALARGVRF